MSAPIQVQGTLTNAKRHVDKSVSITVRSNFEMSTEDFSEIDRILQSTIWAVIAPNEIQPSDIPEEPARTQEGKGKGQRQRAVWFLKWKKRGIDEPFDPWYDRMFESFMDKWKEELD